jgi:DNA-binding CsgD family transcriptional regulator
MLREAELTALERLLEAACAGEAQFALVEGPTGAGKTLLVEQFIAAHPEIRVLRASGERHERGIARGVVDQLLRRACGDAASSDAGARLLDHLLSHTEPLIVVLDDAQWADPESVEAFVFAVRRLGAAHVVALTISRPGVALESLRRLAEGPAGHRILVASITAEELQALTAELGCELSTAAAQRLLNHTEGDLGSIRSLLAELPPETWHDFEDALPAPRAMTADVNQRLAACTAPTARLVEAASVLGSGCVLANAAELAAVDDSLAALEEATAAGLLRGCHRRGLRTLEFSPPAIGAAVYEHLGAAKLAELHLAAAERSDDERVAMRHLALASPGPDERLAARLDDLAGRSDERLEAAIALVAASRLSPCRTRREDRLLRGVDWMLHAGDTAQARGFTGEVAACTQTARRDSILGQLAISGRRVREAGAWQRSAWELCDPEGEPELAANIAHRNAFHSLLHLRDDEVVTWARRALELAPKDRLAVEWTATLALGLWRQGRRTEAYEVLSGARSGDAEAQLRGMRAWLLIAGDDIEAACQELAAAAEAEIRLGAHKIGIVHLNVLARAHFEVGAWDETLVVADRAVALASQLENVSARVFAWWPAMLVPAARGDWATAEDLARHAAAEPTDAPDRVVAVGIAQALIAAARGRAGAVIAALEPVTAITPSAAVDEPGFWPWQHLYGEALVSTGRVEEAAKFLDRHEPLAAERGHRTASARLAVVRGRLEAARNHREAADAAFARAVEQLEPLGRPYDLALARLAMGQFLRREGRRRSAASQLTAAAATFAALGARPALERAERELAGSGLRPSRSAGPERLTPQELTVARLVAAGHTNREAAADLQVSVKTVEVHLTRIYAKLGIGSRTQLARRLPLTSTPDAKGLQT